MHLSENLQKTRLRLQEEEIHLNESINTFCHMILTLHSTALGLQTLNCLNLLLN